MDKKKIDIAAHLKKVQLLNPTKSASSQGGFHCSACSASFKNYDSFLDHQNSKVHLSNIGYVKSAELKSSNIVSVKDKLAALKVGKAKASEQGKISPEEALEKRLKAAEEAEKIRKKEKYDKKKALKKLKKLDGAQ